MIKIISTLTLLAIVSASVAFAAGPEPVAPAPVVAVVPVAPFWEGGYIGAQIGYAYGDFDLDDAIEGGDDEDGIIGV